MKAICCCFVSLVAVVASATIFVSPQDKPPADGAAAVFERPFTNGRAVRRATWAVTAQGVFEAFANGRRVGDDFLKADSNLRGLRTTTVGNRMQFR